MGKIDIRTRELLQDNEEFARLFNMVLHNGEQVISADSLEEVDSESVISSSEITGDKDKKAKRDLLRRILIKQNDNALYMLLGVENQCGLWNAA